MSDYLLVIIDIDRAASIDAATLKYKGLWGIVQEIGELGSVKVDVGCATLQLLPFDLKPIDNPSPQLRDVALRLLRLRKLELDEIEEKMLDVLFRPVTPNFATRMVNRVQIFPGLVQRVWVRRVGLCHLAKWYESCLGSAAISQLLLT